MSGGHFDYKCFEISDFANILKVELSKKSVRKLYQFSLETLANLKEAQKIIKQAGNLAYQVEWLMSSDTGEDWFNKKFKRIMRRDKK